MLRSVILFLAIATINVQSHDLEWTGGSFKLPPKEMKKYKHEGKYVPKNAIAVRAQIFRNDLYLALPRYKPGIPITLAKVNIKSKGFETVLSPFPNVTAQQADNCNGLQSVADLYIDNHAILWALDVGVVDLLGNPIRQSPPKVLAYNLITGKHVRTLSLSGLVVQASRLQYIVVEYNSNGAPFVYVTDAATRSVLVFDIIKERTYRVTLPKVVAGYRRDVLYASLIHKANETTNYLLVTYLSGSRFFAIPTDPLRSGSVCGTIEDWGTKDGKIVIVGSDGGEAVFYRYEGKPQVYRWDASRGRFRKGDLVYQSSDGYLATEVMPDIRRKKMRVLESNFQDYFADKVGCGAVQRLGVMVSQLRS